MKKNCLNWFLSAAFLFLLGSCANKVKPGQEPEFKQFFFITILIFIIPNQIIEDPNSGSNPFHAWAPDDNSI